MFNDMRISADNMTSFKTHLDNLSSISSSSVPSTSSDASNIPEIIVNVLTLTNWPMTSAQSCNLPPSMTKALERYQKFYLSRHSGRKLTWLSQMGTADVRANLPCGRKDLNISTLGAVVLVTCFNDEDKDNDWQSFTQIQEATGISTTELKRTLQGLSVAKVKLLLKSTKGKDVKETDEFKFNVSFTSPLNKIKIQTISASSIGGGNGGSGTNNALESELERSETMEKVDETRKHQVEAAIVRIMKSRKKMDHNNLVAEVICQLSSKFSPSALMVKKRIEGLIERDYMKRDEKDRYLKFVLKYLAVA